MKKIVTLLLGLLIVFYSHTWAEETSSPKKILNKEMDYIVQKGDTLWDISGRFYGDPFLWPRLWQQNQYITNPHWINPGDRIRLYPYRILIQQEEKPLVVEEARPLVSPTLEEFAPSPLVAPPILPLPAAKIHLVSYPEIHSAGFIMDDMEGVGYIAQPRGQRVMGKGERLMLSEGDQAYLIFKDGLTVRKGDRFTIFNVGDRIKHPKTRKVIGRKISILGIIEITDALGKIKMGLITLSFDPISKGDKLIPYILTPEEIAVKRLEWPLNGLIIASEKDRVALSEGDVVYLDRGEVDEVIPGQLFEVFRHGEVTRDPVTKKKIRLPDDLIGRLVVIKTQKKTSTALIVNTREIIHIGDKIIAVTE